MVNVKAVLCGYYGMGNAGDEALLVSLLQMLPEGVTPIVLSGNPQATKKKYGVASCDRKSTFAILKALKQSQVFIWGGGSLMQDATSLASPIYYAGMMALAQQRGLKTIAWAQGIGPLNKSLTRWLTKQVLLGCDAISVRDNASAELLNSWQIESIIAPDPVWAMTSQPGSELSQLNEIDRPKVAVILRSHPLLTERRLQILIRAIQEFQQQTSSHIVIIPFQPTQDMAIARQISAAIADNTSLMNLDDPVKLKGLFKKVKMAIGMRLHGLIMAAAEGCSCFGLSYDPKVTQLMTEIDLPGYELAALPTDSSQIAHQWGEILSQESQLNRLKIQSLTDRAKIHQELLREIIVKG